MATNENFSFRWGIPILDAGDTRIPNWMFDHYIEAGVVRSEFLAILHLSRYQFERQGSECRPSIPTVARQMGYSRRGLQKLLAGLEKKDFEGTSFLVKHLEPGRATTYDFSGFSRAVLAVYLLHQQRGEPQFAGGGEPQFAGGANPSSPKEQHIRKTNNNVVVVSTIQTLVDFGIDHSVAEWLSKHCTEKDAAGWIRYVNGQTNLENAQGLVVSRLRDGVRPPIKKESKQKKRDYLAGLCPRCSSSPCHCDEFKEVDLC